MRSASHPHLIISSPPSLFNSFLFLNKWVTVIRLVNGRAHRRHVYFDLLALLELPSPRVSKNSRVHRELQKQISHLKLPQNMCHLKIQPIYPHPRRAYLPCVAQRQCCRSYAPVPSVRILPGSIISKYRGKDPIYKPRIRKQFRDYTRHPPGGGDLQIKCARAIWTS